MPSWIPPWTPTKWGRNSQRRCYAVQSKPLLVSMWNASNKRDQTWQKGTTSVTSDLVWPHQTLVLWDLQTLLDDMTFITCNKIKKLCKPSGNLQVGNQCKTLQQISKFLSWSPALVLWERQILGFTMLHIVKSSNMLELDSLDDILTETGTAPTEHTNNVNKSLS